jgi:hypothetical protein
MPIEPLMAFAVLSAHLADPFADRAVVLRGAGFDEARWKETEDAWAQRFREPGGEVHAASFMELFTKALGDAVAANTSADGDPPDSARFLTPEAQPWRAEAARVGRETDAAMPPPAHPLACTAQIPLAALRRAVPFGPPPDVSPLGDTLEAGARLPLPALPFTKP